jgi:hypothetical protein
MSVFILIGHDIGKKQTKAKEKNVGVTCGYVFSFFRGRKIRRYNCGDDNLVIRMQNGAMCEKGEGPWTLQ